MAISQVAVCSSGSLWLLGAHASTCSAVLWSKGCKDPLALTAHGNALLSADDLSDLLLCFVHMLLTLPLGANSEQVIRKFCSPGVSMLVAWQLGLRGNCWLHPLDCSCSLQSLGVLFVSWSLTVLRIKHNINK